MTWPERRAAWSAYWAMFAGQRRRVIAGAALALLQGLVLLPGPFLLKALVDHALPDRRLDLLFQLGGVMIALALVATLSTLGSRWLLIVAIKEVTSRLRARLIEHLHALPPAFHSREDQGRLQSIVVNDTSRLDSATAAMVSDILPSALALAGFVGVLLWISPLLTACVVVAVIPALLLARYWAKVFRADYSAWRESFQSFSAGTVRSLRLMPLMRQAGIQREELDARRADIESTAARHQRMAWTGTLQRVTHANTMRVGTLLVLMAGCWMLFTERLSLGELGAFYGAMALLNAQITGLLNGVPTLVGADDTLASIHRLLGQPAVPPYTGTRPHTLGGRIELQQVSFAYEPERPVLRGIDLVIEPGELSALVGPSGEGKTTLMQIILGLLRPDTGRVLVDGVPLDDIDVVHLRRQIGVVSQDVLLINGSIEDNIRLERPDATRAQIERAAALAHLDEFIATLPAGYATPVGEGGTRLSGGQRQRLALARALVREPKLLLLDEPTHGLDPRAAAEVMRTLHSLHGLCSTLIITHDLALIRRADRVHVLSGGRLASGDASAIEHDPAFDALRARLTSEAVARPVS